MHNQIVALKFIILSIVLIPVWCFPAAGNTGQAEISVTKLASVGFRPNFNPIIEYQRKSGKADQLSLCFDVVQNRAPYSVEVFLENASVLGVGKPARHSAIVQKVRVVRSAAERNSATCSGSSNEITVPLSTEDVSKSATTVSAIGLLFIISPE